MPGEAGLRVERDGPVLHLRLDRPERRNPLTRALRRALRAALEGLGEARGPRVALLSSEPGEAAVFAAGADLSDIGALEAAEASSFAEEGQALMRLLEDRGAVVLAAVDGPCHGGALDLALACDAVAVSERARFAHPGARLGIVTGWGGTRRLPERLGLAPAAAAFATGRSWGAEEALQRGLASRLLPGRGPAFAEAARAWAGEWAQRLEGLSREDLGSLKRILRACEPARGRLESAWLRRRAASRSGASE